MFLIGMRIDKNLFIPTPISIPAYWSDSLPINLLSPGQFSVSGQKVCLHSFQHLKSVERKRGEIMHVTQVTNCLTNV